MSFQVVSVPDVDSVYKVPLLLQSQGLIEYFTDKLKLTPGGAAPRSPVKRNCLAKWRELAERFDS